MYKIVFVCLGNICRSPTAEAVFKKIITNEGLDDKIYIDSAGTSAYHVGERADSRMREHGRNRGYDLTSLSRKFIYSDFENFDLIIVMDSSNYTNVKKMDKNTKYSDKIRMMTGFSLTYKDSDVPDPYYGGPEGFDTVIDILEDSCLGLLDYIK